MKLFFIIIIALCLLAGLSCQQPVQPETWQRDNTVGFSVTLVDSSLGVYRIKFWRDSASWEPSLLSRPAIFSLYRRNQGSDNLTQVGLSFGAWSGSGLSSGATYIYKDSLGKHYPILFNNTDSLDDTINTRSLQAFTYGMAAITKLSDGASDADFDYALGFVEKITFKNSWWGGGVPVRMLIDAGAPYTADPWVQVSGQFDTVNVDTLLVYRYSEIVTLDTLSIWLTRISDSSASHAPFQLSYRNGEKIMVKVQQDGSVVRLITDTKMNTFSYPFGRLGRVDTVVRVGGVWSSAGRSYFDTVRYESATAHFWRQDTLLPGLGNKWVMIKPLPHDTARPVWSPLFDDIAIQPYTAELLLDFLKASGSLQRNTWEKKLNFRGQDIPFVYRAFDSTFIESVYVWVATRNGRAAFFDTALGAQKISNPKTSAQWGGRDSTWPDCILETPPQGFRLNSYGTVNAEIKIDDLHGFRVSPLCGTNLTSGLIDNINRLPGLLPLSVRCGSILGYRESRLNSFAPDTVVNYSRPGSYDNALTLGWHVVDDAAGTGTRYGVPRDSLAEYFPSYDGVRHVNPFRNLPLNTGETRFGAKEFIFIAYTRGKYFGEPRVFISTASYNYAYVWDKCPPHILWNLEFDPSNSLKYAPMYYRDPKNSANDRITNLKDVNYIFDVFLSSDGDEQGLKAGIRDAGFGKIAAVTLCLHARTDTSGFNVDPVTGLREYRDGSPVKRYGLSQEQLAGQSLSAYSANPQRRSYCILDTRFTGIDASSWETGIWDMWIETEDDLGNKGVAPFGGAKNNPGIGALPVRSIEIK